MVFLLFFSWDRAPWPVFPLVSHFCKVDITAVDFSFYGKLWYSGTFQHKSFIDNMILQVMIKIMWK